MNPSIATATYPSQISKEIEVSLISFSNITGIPVTYFNNEAIINCEYNSGRKICKFLSSYHEENSVCKKKLISSIKIASTLGEPYIFTCSAGFVNIAISLIIKGEVVGCFIAGPLVMGKLNRKAVNNILSLNSDLNANLNDINLDYLANVLSVLKEMRVFGTREVTNISVLLNNCIVANLLDSIDYRKVNTNYKDQVQVGMNLQKQKKSHATFQYPYELETKTIQSIKEGHLEEAHATVKKLLNAVILMEAGNLEFIKIRLLELCTLLSRAAVESGTALEKTISKNFDYINTLNAIEDIQALTPWSKSLVNHFCKNVFESLYNGQSQIIKQAVNYINSNLESKLRLIDLANYLHVNDSYLSTLFKKEMGHSFTEFVTSCRIKKSKELLKKTTLRLIDVSQHCGFEDQSYFTKVFKSHVGCSPSEFRKY